MLLHRREGREAVSMDGKTEAGYNMPAGRGWPGEILKCIGPIYHKFNKGPGFPDGLHVLNAPVMTLRLLFPQHCLSV